MGRGDSPVRPALSREAAAGHINGSAQGLPRHRKYGSNEGEDNQNKNSTRRHFVQRTQYRAQNGRTVRVPEG